MQELFRRVIWRVLLYMEVTTPGIAYDHNPKSLEYKMW
jgi:hypothetical protein